MIEEDHYMIDIETLGTGPNSHILSIVCLKFNPLGDLHSDENPVSMVWERWDITPQSCEEVGLEIDVNTVLWWLQQSEGARMNVIGLDRKKIRLRDALVELSSFIKRWSDDGPTHIWAKSPQFDLVILENAYRKCNLRPPWKYKDHADVRTAVMLWKDQIPNYEEVKEVVKEEIGGVTHDPLFDCFLQAYQLSYIFSLMQKQ